MLMNTIENQDNTVNIKVLPYSFYHDYEKIKDYDSCTKIIAPHIY